jgi:hypothetical protein
MIVIATNNGKNYLPNLLNSLEDIDLLNNKILILDTGSTDKEYLSNLKSKHEIIVDRTPYSGYDTGAYIYAYNNYIDENYLFLQDSIIIKEKSLIRDGLSILDNNTIVPLIIFDPKKNFYDNHVQMEWVNSKIGSHIYEYGIFGPMFFAKRITLDKIKNINNAIPYDKNTQQAMERGWSVFFKQNGINIVPLERYEHSNYLFDIDGYKYIKKFFPIRK